MPWAVCPACHADARYPKNAATGTQVTCPECDEVFVPPELRPRPPKIKKPKKYDPETDSDVYKVGRTAPNAADRDKDAAYEAAARAGRRRARELDEMKYGHKRRPWYEGPEVWLLIFAAGAGLGLPFGIWLARNWQKMSDAKVFWLFAVLIAVGLAALGLGGSAWAWLRRNR